MIKSGSGFNEHVWKGEYGNSMLFSSIEVMPPAGLSFGTWPKHYLNGGASSTDLYYYYLKPRKDKSYV